MYKIGRGKAEIKSYEEGLGMMGYGRSFNVVKGKATDLFSRCLCIEHQTSKKRVYFINVEMCFITSHLKRTVIAKLNQINPSGNYSGENMLFTAQHTHSAPGGYANYPLYNFSIPGFRQSVFDAFLNGIIESVLKSEKNLQTAVMKIGKGEFEPDMDVAFNRSLKAYNQNKDVNPLLPTQTHLAVNRQMNLLRFETESGEELGLISFFGVHTTSVGNKVLKICSDNKGFASKMMEEEKGGDFIAIFAQGVAGDISPNFHGKGKKWPRGKFKDEIKSAEFNGELQYIKAKEIFKEAKTEIKGDIDTAMAYYDFANVIVKPEFADGREDAYTVPACHGVAFFLGTPVDGKGMPAAIAGFAKSIANGVKAKEMWEAKHTKDKALRDKILRKYHAQGKKHILLESGEGRIFGTDDVKNFFLPDWVDGALGEMKRAHARGALGEKPWVPHILPLQIIQVGNLAVVGFPGEITTVAGKRIQQLMEKELKTKGIEHVIIASYSNAYMGYVTTFEEYQVQCYEGGHTVFGQWTLGAFQTKFQQLAQEFCKTPEQRDYQGVIPPEFSEKEMSLRSY